MGTVMQRTGATAMLSMALAAAAPGADWPQWGGRDERNMVSPEKLLPATFSVGLAAGGGADANGPSNVRWVAALGSATYASPTIAGGRVFIGTNDGQWRDARVARSGGGVVVCLDERTGRLLWRLLVPRYERKVHGSGFDDLLTGVCSSPTVLGNRAYLVTNRAEVLCLDTRGQANGNDGPFREEGQYLAGDGNEPVALRPGDGDIVWRFDMIGQVPCAPHDVTNCNVLVLGRHVYVCTGNGVHRMPSEPNPLPDAPSLIVLDRDTGRLVGHDNELIGRRVFHGQWSSPSLARVGGRTLVLFGAGDGVCYAFEPLPARAGAGEKPAVLKKVWWYDCNPPEFKVRDGQPIDYWDGDATRARVPRNYLGPSEIIATPVCHAGKVYAAVGRDPDHGKARGILHCIDATGTGNVTQTGRVWTCKDVGRSMSTVAVTDGLVFAADLAGDVRCLDARTGRTRWVHRTKQEIWGSPLAADGKLYVLTRKKTLWVFRASGVEQLLAKVRLPRASACTPVAANGVLYLATNRLLYALRRGGE